MDLVFILWMSFIKAKKNADNKQIIACFVSNEATTLKIFDQWNIMEDKLLAGVDGQKFETRLHTLQSSYSSKYFGINKKGFNYK